MTKQLALNSQDAAVLSQIVDRLRAKSKKEQGIQRLLYRWDSFVDSVVSGYKLTFDDYVNELDTRNNLAEIMNSFSDDGQKQLALFLDPPDEKFKATTIPITHALWKPQPVSNWWWYRAPRNPPERLKKGLVLLGDIKE